MSQSKRSKASESPETPAPAESATPAATGEVKRDSFGKAAVQIIVGALVFAGLTAGYVWNAKREHAIQMLFLDARPMVELADVASLRGAAAKLEEAQAVMSSDKITAGLAEVHSMLYALHGIEESKATAQELVADLQAADVQRAERFAAAALLAYAEGKYDEAVTVSRSVLDQGGVSERLNWTLGLAERAKGDLQTGRDNLRKALDSKSGAPHYAVALGDAYEEDGDSRNANLSWASAYSANGKYIPADARQLISRVRRGEDAKVLARELERLDALAPDIVGKLDKASIELLRSELSYRRGLTQEALKAANESIALGGETAMRLFAKGSALLAEGKVDEGLKAYEAARAKVPGAQKYYYATAKAYSAAGKYKEARAILDSQKDDRVDDADYHAAMGDVFTAEGDYAKAAGAYNKALKISEKHAEAMLGQGIVLWRQKKYDDATGWLEKAIAARGKFGEVYEAIGLMWIEQGAASQADPQLQEAEKIYISRGTDAVKMQKFYAKVIKTLTDNRATSLVAPWVEREKAFRAGT